MTLTEDQRILLYGIGGWPILWCLATPEYGIPHFFSSMHGGTMLPRVDELRPGWARFGYDTHTVIAFGPYDGAPDVSVTRSQLTSFAKSLPVSLVQRLRQCRTDGIRLARVRSDSCRIGYTGHYASLDRYRPRWSKERLNTGRNRMAWAIRDQETDLVREALGIDDITDEPTDLLELLAVNE